MSQESQLTLKSIHQLLSLNFIIPSYQRGYRWTSTQITQLLDDIYEFIKRKSKVDGEFYCLQPIVVKAPNKESNDWEVIDGQQRLTSLYILLKYLEDIAKLLNKDFQPYSINYLTRIESKNFLASINENKTFDENIDFYFMHNAYETITNWFESVDDSTLKLEFVNVLLKTEIIETDSGKIDQANNIRVIWYEVQESEKNNSIDIFTRLNIGKISLTNSELIKAMLLRKGNFEEKTIDFEQIQIASEWDIIEKKLQDDAFWFFIYNESNPLKYETRIEYIFDLMTGKTQHHEDYYTFIQFYEKMQTNSSREVWKDIKGYFLTFEEWYNNHTLYHYIGYLVACGTDINKLKQDCSHFSKNKFIESKIIPLIREKVACNIDEIYFGSPYIKNILLLFNIQTILESKKSEMRFPFDKFKAEQWDIEHVRSQTDKSISERERIAWIEDMKNFFGLNTEHTYVGSSEETNECLINIRKLLTNLIETTAVSEDSFTKCYNEIQKYFGEDEQLEEKSGIDNLALLDATTNRSYKNAFFPIKRQKIRENDKNGIFTPIATKNLFLKYYSKKLDEVMFWKEQDANDYLEAIKDSLKDFLPKKQNNEDISHD